MSGFLNTIVLLGALQGFIAAGLLFFISRNRKSNRFLAWIILLIALACFNLYSERKDWYGSDLLRFLGEIIPTIVIMPLGPLLWFYIRSSLDPEFVLTRKRRLHFITIIIDFGPTIIIIVFLAGILSGLWKNDTPAWGLFIDYYNAYADVPRWISLTVYTIMSYRIVQKSSSRWLRQFTTIFLCFLGLWLIFLVPYVISPFSNSLLNLVDWYMLYIPMVLMIYWLGIKGYMISVQTGIMIKKKNGISNSLTETAIHDTAARLIKSMEEEKLYLNPELNLQVLSQHTGLQQKLISAVLNNHVHKSFNAFVNEYRVEAFKKKIRQADMENFTMAGIAAECGFNSQATFQRTFKELTGMSPSEFKKRFS